MRTILVIGLLSLLGAAPAATAGDWTHDLALYGWFSGLEGTIGVADAVSQEVNATFDDLSGYVDFAMAGHYEARGPKSVYVADISYVGLGSERDAEVGNQPVKVDMDLTQWIFEFAGGLRVDPKIDLLLATRYYNIDTGATLTGQNNQGGGSVSKGWLDLYLGARYHTTFGERWFASVRGDIGTGGSDFAWFGQVQLGYRFADHWGASVAWRILSLDHEADVDSADYFKYDITQNGLGVGVGYRF